MKKQYALILLLAALSVAGCDKKKTEVDALGRANAPAAAAAPVPNGMPMPMAEESGETASSGKIHQGTILETMDVTNYTYIHYQDAEGLKHWAAVLKGKFEVGSPVAIVESIVQKNFTSPTLNRTFDTIVFGNVANAQNTAKTAPDAASPADTAAAPPAAVQLPAGHPPINTEKK